MYILLKISNEHHRSVHFYRAHTLFFIIEFTVLFGMPNISEICLWDIPLWTKITSFTLLEYETAGISVTVYFEVQSQLIIMTFTTIKQRLHCFILMTYKLLPEISCSPLCIQQKLSCSTQEVSLYVPTISAKLQIILVWERFLYE
jgi:hypothetical protein